MPSECELRGKDIDVSVSGGFVVKLNFKNKTHVIGYGNFAREIAEAVCFRAFIARRRVCRRRSFTVETSAGESRVDGGKGRSVTVRRR